MNTEPNEIRFECPKCKRHLVGDKALLGETINCPECGEPFVPSPERPEIRPDPVAAPAEAPATQSSPIPSRPRWWKGLIVVLSGILLLFISALFLRGNLGPLAILLIVYGFFYLLACLALRRWAGKRIGIGRLGANLASLVGTSAVVVLLLWGGAELLLLQLGDQWNRAQTVYEDESGYSAQFKAAEQAIKAQLVSPASAKFGSTADFIRNEDNIQHASIRLVVDSQNKYGAMIHTKWQVELRQYGFGKDSSWDASHVAMIETSEK